MVKLKIESEIVVAESAVDNVRSLGLVLLSGNNGVVQVSFSSHSNHL